MEGLKMKRKKRKTVFLILLLLLVILILKVKSYFSPKYYTNADFGIETVTSSNDKDGDGIDDQTDFLQGVKKYIETKPKYKSVYYATGYSDNEYGVCTDVVVNGYLYSGYDIMSMVNEDILQNPEDYDIEQPDKNIDFRRVRNLNVYLKHTAQELTCDIHDISQWQGGDIVVFKKHIGVVSDHRNKDGIPYVIHHGSPTQIGYEQDILEKREDEIIGHYRLN